MFVMIGSVKIYDFSENWQDLKRASKSNPYKLRLYYVKQTERKISEVMWIGKQRQFDIFRRNICKNV